MQRIAAGFVCHGIILAQVTGRPGSTRIEACEVDQSFAMISMMASINLTWSLQVNVG
jgi:hypothetical protein